MARRTKRLWTDEEKRSICLQTTAPGVSVAQVARRYAMNANLIFKWLRDTRYAPGPPGEPEASCFLPVEIVDLVPGAFRIALSIRRVRLARSRSTLLAATGYGSRASTTLRRSRG